MFNRWQSLHHQRVTSQCRMAMSIDIRSAVARFLGRFQRFLLLGLTLQVSISGQTFQQGGQSGIHPQKKFVNAEEIKNRETLLNEEIYQFGMREGPGMKTEDDF